MAMTPLPAVPEARAVLAAPTLGLLPVLAISAMAALPVAAQTAVDLDEVTIRGEDPSAEARSGYKKTSASSDKMTAPLLNTPKTVTIITEKQIEERGAASLKDVLRTTPGVTLGTGEGGTPIGDRPFIRGFEASTDISVDGLRALGRSSYESFNLESVEISKGPGGAYSGRGSTGGSVNMVSKAPVEDETFQKVSTSVGTGDQKRLTYDGNWQLGDAVAARLNLMLQDSGVPGRDVLRDKRFGIAPSVAWRLNEASKLTASLYYSHTDATPDYGIPFASRTYSAGGKYGAGTKADPFEPLGNVDRSNFYGSAQRDYREVDQTIATLKFDHEFSPSLRMSSVLSYINNHQEYVNARVAVAGSAAAPEVTRPTRVPGRRFSETLAFSTNFQAEAVTGNIEHAISFGFEASREAIRSVGAISAPVVGNTDLFNPNPWMPFDPTGAQSTVMGSFGSDTPTVTESKSLYFFDTMTFSPQWMANVGLRLDDYRFEGENFERHDTMVNYQLGLMYKPVEAATLYASIGTSSDPAGTCAAQAGGSGAACGSANTDPEKSTSYEIGAKWDLPSGLQLSAALFKTVKDNQRAVVAGTGVNNIPAEYELVGNSEAKGFELGAAGQITDKWAVFAGYTYLDARLIDGGADPDDNGNRLMNTAQDSFSLWTTYALTDKWTVGGGATYVGKRFTSTANTHVLPAYWKADLMTSYQFNEQSSLRLNVNNLFDETIYEAGHAGVFANVQPGRNAVLTLDYKF